jgi:hypothetical protein
MRKGVGYLFRYQQVSFQANSRYLEALAVVQDPTKAKRDLERVTTRKTDLAVSDELRNSRIYKDAQLGIYLFTTASGCAP